VSDNVHSEQIMIRPCGIIVAHQTFFGSPQTVVLNQFAEKGEKGIIISGANLLEVCHTEAMISKVF